MILSFAEAVFRPWLEFRLHKRSGFSTVRRPPATIGLSA